MNADSRGYIATVAAGYDVIGDAYFDAYRAAPFPAANRFVDEFVANLPSAGAVLDLGCGNGLPVTAGLAERFEVTGVDVSPEQVERARKNVPSANFVAADMTTLSFLDATFHGVLALYSIIHVPRGFHAELLRSIYTWLKPGGVFLGTFGSTDSENWIEEDWFGAPMYWSHFDAQTSANLVRDSGFSVLREDLVVEQDPQDGDEPGSHLWIVAVRPG